MLKVFENCRVDRANRRKKSLPGGCLPSIKQEAHFLKKIIISTHVSISDNLYADCNGVYELNLFSNISGQTLGQVDSDGHDVVHRTVSQL